MNPSTEVGLQNIGTQANASSIQSKMGLPYQISSSLENLSQREKDLLQQQQSRFLSESVNRSHDQAKPAVQSLKQNNLHWYLIRKMLEKKDFNELCQFKQRLQMQKIGEIYMQTKDGKLDEEAIWKQHEIEQQKQQNAFES